MSSVKASFGHLEGLLDVGLPWKEKYYHSVLSEIQFLFTAVWGKILMLDNLIQHGLFLTNMCTLCYNDEEFISHLLLHCPFSVNVFRIWFHIALVCQILTRFPNTARVSFRLLANECGCPHFGFLIFLILPIFCLL